MTHLTYARAEGHCDKPPGPCADNVKDVTCPRCQTVIGFYRDSRDVCLTYGFGTINDVTKRNIIAIIPHARIVASDFDNVMLDALELTLK